MVKFEEALRQQIVSKWEYRSVIMFPHFIWLRYSFIAKVHTSFHLLSLYEISYINYGVFKKKIAAVDVTKGSVTSDSHYNKVKDEDEENESLHLDRETTPLTPSSIPVTSYMTETPGLQKRTGHQTTSTTLSVSSTNLLERELNSSLSRGNMEIKEVRP